MTGSIKAPKKILIVTGTRPNFVKVTQFKRCAAQFEQLDIEIVHTGQHYDRDMSEVFFQQFGLVPDYFLNIKAGSPISQIAEIMQKLETLLAEVNPDLLMVVGDVNSTLAGALVANKAGTPLAHLESGLRSLDHTMPEEINRIITDQVTQFFFVTEESGMKNLQNEGKNPSQLFMVGNTMIDTLVAFRNQVEENNILEELGISANEFVLMTIHRPATVDYKDKLERLLELIEWMHERKQVVFPIHPRTIQNLKKFGLYDRLTALSGVHLMGPQGYFAFQKLVASCSFVLTDSGGIQEETTFLQKPCLTLRPNTERPITIDMGTNTLIGENWDSIPSYVEEILGGTYKIGEVPPLWDGQATQRILQVLNDRL